MIPTILMMKSIQPSMHDYQLIVIDSLDQYQFKLLGHMVSTTSNASRSKGHKYSKVTQQKKFHLLNLILKEHHPIRTAAAIAGIKFLTAKTILFFHKNNCRSYRFDIERPEDSEQRSCITASFSAIKKLTDINDKLIKPKSRIEVICSIGNVLSPPKVEQVNSPTTCSRHQDAIVNNAPSLCFERLGEENGNTFRINGEKCWGAGFKQMIERSSLSLWKVKAVQTQNYRLSEQNHHLM